MATRGGHLMGSVAVPENPKVGSYDALQAELNIPISQKAIFHVFRVTELYK